MDTLVGDIRIIDNNISNNNKNKKKKNFNNNIGI